MSRDRWELPAGDYVFLAFLLWAPMSAYDIKKLMATSVSNFWTAAHSQVYQQARRLVRDGYVREQEAPGGRRKRILSLTPKGRRAVRAWLTAPSDPPEFYYQSLVKLFFAAQAGDPAATAAMLRAERERATEVVAGYEALAETLRDQPEWRYPALTLELGIALARTTIEWLDRTIPAVERDAGDC